MAQYTNDVNYNPTAALSGGFFGYITEFAIGGYGLVTFGFLWGNADNWAPCCEVYPAVWEECQCEPIS